MTKLKFIRASPGLPTSGWVPSFKQISITNQSNPKRVLLFGSLELGDSDIVCYLFIGTWYFLNSSIQPF